MANSGEEKLSIVVRKRILSSLSQMTSFLLKPFLRADSLSAYATSGYVLLGVFSLLFYLYFFCLGYLSYPMSRAAPIFQLAYKLIADRLGLKFIPDSMASAAILPLIFYVFFFTYSPTRNWMGEKFANFIFWIADRAVTGGEWCIEHRWQSLLLIMVLVSVLTGVVSRRFEQTSHERVLRRDFVDWLKHAEDFVDQNPVAKPEYEKYRHVKVFWKDSFDALNRAPGGYRHPAIYLNRMLDILYAKERDETWVETLRYSVADLEACMKDCDASTRAQRDESEAKAWALMNILMGRIYVRLEEDKSESYHALSKAMERFSAVDSPIYAASAINGKGTVYAHAFTAYLASTKPVGTPLAILQSICPNAYQCAWEALKSYDQAAVNQPPCSFQSRRKNNNIADLLSRIGMHYNEVVGQVTNPPLEDWISSPSALAKTIRGKLSELMVCNYSDPVLSSFFVTAAQGFGASARLRMLAGEDPTSDIESSGAYLRLASSFEPKSTSTWELAYFCPILQGETYKNLFINSINRSFDGLPNGDRLIHKIELACR